MAQAQNPPAAQLRTPHVLFDRNGGSYTSVLPFDQHFVLVNAAPAALLRVTAWYADSTELPRDECSDLNGRKRITRAVQTAVAANAGDLLPREQDALVATLLARLRDIPLPEVLDTIAREPVMKAFADALSHASGQQVPALTLRRVQQALDVRLNALRVWRVSRAQWTRSTAPAVTDSFALDVRPLHPNRDYTFCVQSVESLAAVDSTALIRQAAAGVRAALRDHFASMGRSPALDAAALRTLQRKLREAVVPAADSIVVPPSSLLAYAPPLAEVTKAFARIADADSARCQFASFYNAMATLKGGASAKQSASVPSTATQASAGAKVVGVDETKKACGDAVPILAGQITFAGAIRRLAADGGLLKLPLKAATEKMASEKATPDPQAARMVLARVVLLTLRGLRDECPPAANTCPEIETVSRGQTPLINPRLPTEGNANIQARASSAELRPWAENLDSTMASLRDLLDLVNLLDGEGAPQAALDTTRLRIEGARTAAGQQRIYLRLIMEKLDTVEAAVQALASTVVGRQVRQVGVVTTSSASYETRARWHVGQDIGAVFAFRGSHTHEFAPYLGVSIYFVPVNKRGEYPSFCPLDPRCTAISVGVTTSKFEQKDTYTGVLGGIPLVLGIATRVGDYVRISYGKSLIYSNRYAAGGVVQRRLNNLNSVSVSLDAELQEILGGVAKGLFGK